jgi:conjugal transfer pilus assembly protein TraK
MFNEITRKIKIVSLLLLSTSAYAQDGPVFQGITLDVPGLAIGDVDNPRAIVTADGKVSTGGSSISSVPKEKRPEQYPLHLQVSPGVNEIISVSSGRINRFITPFSDPVVDSTNDFIFDKQGSVVLITPKGTAPISLFMREVNNPNVAISLTLVPRPMPSREVHLTFADSSLAETAYRPSAKATKWELSSSLQKTISDVYSLLASENSKLPPGYSLRDTSSKDIPFFTCALEGITTNLEQVVEGGHFSIGILSAKNETSYVLEPDESSCRSPGAISASIYPSVIKPGGWSEVFVIRNRSESKTVSRSRPKAIPQQ